jgi:hypothetical protein
LSIPTKRPRAVSSPCTRRRVLGATIALVLMGAGAQSASAYSIYSNYNGGCFPAEYEGVTHWDGGSSSTSGTVHGYLYKYYPQGWIYEKDAGNSNSGVGPRQARVALHDPQDAPQQIVSYHTGTFLSGTQVTGAEYDGVCS